MIGALRIAIVLVAAAAAALVASFVLLGVASGRDPVGRLTPQSALVRPSPTPTTAKPSAVVPPLPTRPHEHEQHADD